MFALDTNIAIDLLRRRAATLARVGNSDEYYLPAPVVGELIHGAFRSHQPVGERAMLEKLIQMFPVLNVDQHAAEYYGQIKFMLESQGQRIPENDMWIAAVCMRFGMALVTRDQHFARVAGLSCHIW